MQLIAGTRLGPYEIVAAVGEGGMGQVYKATDTRLNRAVAIKVMPPHFADDPDMKQRFDREAQTIAGLNHPNICTLHDVGRLRPEGASASQGEISFLVLEFLEGETLADRIARGNRKAMSGAATAPSGSKSGPFPTLSLDDALKTATAIADALDKAHRKGVIHRDLKPANVMLVKNGSSTPLVKLLDFGLAKWVGGENESLGAMPTRADLSTPGMILGTLQYMAPEQVEGKDADARADVFAFGAVLYELITGRRAFEGKSQATLISAIMTGEPPSLMQLLDGAAGERLRPARGAKSPSAREWGWGPTSIRELDHLIRRCLAKDREDRWQDAHSLLIQLRWIAQGRTESERPSAIADANRKRALTTRIALAAAVVLIAMLAVPAVLYVRGSDPLPAFPMRVPVTGLSPANFAVAPDGRDIAVVAQPEGQETPALYVRRIDTPVFRRLPGTEGAAQPFWSPDSRSVAFVMAGTLKRVDATGGAPKDIAPVTSFSGGAWNRTNQIVFGSDTGIFRVSAEGGTPAAITHMEKPETGHFWPSFLPDGIHYLFLAWSSEPSERVVYISALDSKDRTRLMQAETNAVYAPSAGSGRAPGYLLFHRQASLFAQPFDHESRTLSGDADQVAGGLGFTPADGRGYFAASETGVLVFDRSRVVVASGRGWTSNEEFAWVARSGARREPAVPAGMYGDMDLSLDQRSIAITRNEGGVTAADIWVVDWKTGNETRLTFDPSDDINPIWSHDGKQIAFTTYRAGNADIFVKNANGVGEETPLVQTPADEFVEAWSPDGRFIAYLVARDGGFQDIHVLPVLPLNPPNNDRKPFPVVQGPFRKDEPQFSYDGKWLAYTSDESAPGKFEVYVVSFPGLDQKRKISIGGGGQPRWRRDGREIYYRSVNDYMAVDFVPGPRLDSGVPHVMFPMRIPGGGNVSSSNPTRHQWAAAPDGQSFLVRVGTGGVRAGPGNPTIPLAANSSQFAGRGPGGRGPGGRGQVAPSLSVILRWPASLGTQGK